MKLLKELLELPETLLEAAIDDIKKAAKPVELSAIVKLKDYKNIIKKLWGSEFIAYKGQPFFKDKNSANYGPAYEGLLKAAEKEFKHIEMDPIYVEDPKGKESEINNIKFQDGPQEVYLGYDPKSDKLYVGYDANADIDAAFSKWSDKFDDEDPAVEKSLDKTWREIQNQDFQGVLFELDTKNGKNFSADVTDIEKRGFYKGIYKSPMFKHKKLIDLRLD